MQCHLFQHHWKVALCLPPWAYSHSRRQNVPSCLCSFRPLRPFPPLLLRGWLKEMGREPCPMCDDHPSFSCAWQLEEGILRGQTAHRVRCSTWKLGFLLTNGISSVCFIPFLDVQSMARTHKASPWRAQSIFKTA